MSIKLIAAIEENDLSAVSFLLEDPTVDINFLYVDSEVVSSHNPDPENCVSTPLSFAIRRKRWSIAKFLIEKGAKLEEPNRMDYPKDVVLRHPYVYGCSLGHELDAQVFKMMLARVTVINAAHDGWSGHDCFCITSLVDSAKMMQRNFALVGIALHEALVRGDVELINVIVKEKEFPFYLSVASFKEHIGNRTFTEEQIHAICYALISLAKNQIITPEIAKEVSDYLQIPNSPHKLTQTEKMLAQISQQKNEIEGLKVQNIELITKVDHLTERLAGMEKTLRLALEKLTSLTAGVDDKQEVAPPGVSMLFKRKK